jgi:purine-binding chemotaxis protein CheW
MNPGTATKQYCTFAVGPLLIGLEAERVREILFDQELTPVPLAPPSVAGILNLRGEIMTAIDARRRLGLAEDGDDGEAASVHAIITTEGEAVSLIVDAEREVVELDPDTAQHAPETIRAELRKVVEAIYELGGTLLLALDADRTVSIMTN